MKLFTKEIDKKLFEQYPKGGSLENQMVVAKIFNPYGRGTWYIINSDPEDPDYLWAIVDLFEVEVGSVNRSDLENAKVKPFMLGFERDTSFKPVNASELYNGLLDGKRYADGGSIGDENKDMVMNNNVQIMHHAKELSEAVKNAKQIPAWVVAKVYDATQTLSDVTHYLDGENKYADGGGVGKKIVVNTYNGEIEYSNKDIQEMIDDIDMYWDADKLPKWIYKTGKAGHPDFPKNKKQVIKVLSEIKNSKNDVYINVSSKEPFYTHIIKMAKGGNVIDKYRDELEAMDDLELANVVYDKLGFSREETLEQLQQNEAYRDDLIDSILDSYSSSLRSRGEKFATGGGVEFDKDEIEKSAVFYTDESRWSTKPSISEFESKIKNDKESLSKLENKEITPSKIVGGGYKSSAAAKKVAKEYLEKRILVNQRAIEILKSRGEKYATGGGVGSIPKAINDKINEINSLIEWAKDKENYVGGYFGGTYYEYLDFEKPIKVTGNFVNIEYNKGGGAKYKERFNTNKKGEYDTNGLVELKQELSRIASAFNRAKKKYEKDGYFAKGGTTKQEKKVAKVMHEFKEGELHSGKSGKVVTDPKQAIAIALSESRKMENGGTLPYTYSLIRKWSDNMVTDADIDSVIQAMIKAKITDADLVTPPTKTGTQFTKAKEKLNNEIFKKIQEVYVGNLKGNQPYGIIATMVDRATRFGDKTIAEYKKQNTPTKSGWKHKKTIKA